MKYSAEKIGKRIKLERDKKGWSQKGLGDELGQKSGAKQVSLYESGTLPPLDVLLKMCDIFNCELGYLLCEPGYELKTKEDNIISDSLGLDEESIDSIRNITGVNSKTTKLFKADNKEVLNSLLSEKLFYYLIQQLVDLDRFVSEYNDAFNKIIKKYGKKQFDKAMDLYTSSTVDIFHDDRLESSQKKYAEICGEIDAALDKQYESSFNIKLYRYESIETFRQLTDKLYPRILNESYAKQDNASNKQ